MALLRQCLFELRRRHDPHGEQDPFFSDGLCLPVGPQPRATEPSSAQRSHERHTAPSPLEERSFENRVGCQA